MKTFSGSDSFSLESLEGRSLMSAVPVPAAAGPSAAVVIADASFLNAASDPSPTTGQDSTNDADQYDFGGVWGSRSAGTQAAGMQVRASPVDLDNGAIDQDPGGGYRRGTPSDLNSVATSTYTRPAAYKGDAPVIIDNTDPVIDDAPATPAEPEAVVQAPVVNTPAPAAQPQAPQAIAVSASSGDAGICWIELGGKKKVDGTVEQIVIERTFIAG